MRMPDLESERLVIRPFMLADLDAVHDLLDVQLAEADIGTEGTLPREARERWLQWSVLNEEALAHLKQPPYGDRAVVLKATGALIGACGYVPCFGPFGQLDSAAAATAGPGAARAGGPRGRYSTEFGLYYAVSPAWQRRGIATEAARLLADYAFDRLNLARIVATTTHDNVGSTRVMAKLEMRIERNPHPVPPWFQVVGTLDHPAARP
jgi:RimJ/RimL family protein N-acetyltransferase